MQCMTITFLGLLIISQNTQTTLTKIFLVNKSTKWINIVDDIINIYNSKPHTALEGLSPYQAMRPEHFNEVVKINLDKMNNNRMVSDLEIGDKVRKYDLFKKSISKPSMTPSWSDKVFIVKQVQGQTILLDDNTKHKRYKLLKVPDDTKESDQPNIISSSLTKK